MKPFEKLNQKRQLFFFIGLVISLGLVLSAFQLKHPPAEPVHIFGQFDEPIDIISENIKYKVIKKTAHKSSRKKTKATVSLTKILTTELISEIDTTTPELDSIPDDPELKNEGAAEFKVITVAEIMPELDDLGLFLQNHIRFDYDVASRYFEPMVFLSFIVLEDGSLYNIEVLSSPDPELTQSALEAVAKMPKWSPGMHNGVPVKVQLTLPIRFRTY